MRTRTGSISISHFKKYVDVTKGMITARRLFETESIFLSLRQQVK